MPLAKQVALTHLPGYQKKAKILVFASHDGKHVFIHSRHVTFIHVVIQVYAPLGAPTRVKTSKRTIAAKLSLKYFYSLKLLQEN